MEPSVLSNEKFALRERIAELEAQLVESVNQRQFAETALAGGNDRFQVLFETMALGVVYQDDLGDITLANPAAERILGLSLGQMQGRKSIDPRWRAIHEDGTDFPGEQHPASLALHTGNPVLGVVMGVYQPQKEAYSWILIDAIPEFQADETRPYRIYTTFADITARKRVEEELRESERNLQNFITEHKWAEESLFQSEEKYAKIFHTSPMLMAITELGSGLYTEVNDIFLCTLGFTREEVVGHTSGELNLFVRPEQAVTAMQIMQTQGALSDFEVEVRAKSGKIHQGLFGAEFIELDGKRYLLTVMNDITERKKIEEQLIASEVRNRAIIDSVPDLLFEMDETGVFLGYSALDIDKLYARPEAFLGKNIFDVLPKPMALKTMNMIKEALSQKKLIKFEYDLNMDGHQRFYEDRIVPLTENSILSVIRDITEIKWTENELRENNSKLELVLQTANMAWWEMDITNGNVKFDKRKAEMLGYPPENFKHYKDFVALVHPEDSGTAMNAMQRHIDGLADKYEVEYRILSKSDGYKWFYDLGAITRKDSKGMPLYVTGSVIDINERKLAERNLLQRTEDLQLINALNDAANRGEDLDSILQLLVRETSSVFNCQDVSIYLISPDGQYIEMQHTTVSQKLLDKVDKLIGRSIPKVRYSLSESSFFKELLAAEQGTLISGKKSLERWLSVFAETIYPAESLRPISKKIVPHIMKIMKIRSVILIPLISSGRTIGLMDITSRELLTDETHQRMRSLSNQVTAVLLRKQVEKKSMIQLRRLSAMSEIDRVISSSMNIRLALDTLLTQALSQLHVEAASVLLLDAPSQMLEYAAGKGFRSLNIRQSRVQVGVGLAGRAGLERKTLHVPDLSAKGSQFQYRDFLEEENFVEYFGVPLIAKGVLKGVLEIFSRTPLGLDLDWLNYLESLGGQAAIAIDNVQLFEGMQQSNQELITAYDATIAGWSHAMDLRDKETEGHTQRVTNLTVQLARKMGINQQEMVQVRRGALLHDIGKLGIPDNILLKPGKLTDEEWVIMRQHTTYAFDMLMPIAYLRPAMDIPYCHHEKWDGSGYPRGLKGEQIPLVARIFSIVDVWDALRSGRPYRARWTVEKVREHIIELSGKHFDPGVVEVFISFLDVSPDFK